MRLNKQANFKFLSVFILSLLWGFSTTQAENKPKDYIISGTIIDDAGNQPMEYATIRLFTMPERKLVDGLITDKSGQFRIAVPEAGSYMLDISFIGFETLEKAIEIGDERHTRLGEIKLLPHSEGIEEVVVTANQHAVEYKIDRKVINVSEQYAALSGTAVDVLENVPSVQVDIEGNVSLRGNSNFTVLIDNRPTVLDANDALQQIPAGMIQNIEIITNPSAKYDPEGTAGIINIITKKRSLNGISGIASANIGLDDKYGADILLNFRTNHFNVFVNGDFNQRTYPGFSKEERHTTFLDTTHYLLSEGDRMWSRQHYSMRAGVEWFPNDNNTVSISARRGKREMRRETNTDYQEWYSFSDERTNFDSEAFWRRGGNFNSLSTDYVYKFNGSNEHRIDAEFMYFMREGDERSENNLYNQAGEISDGQISTERGPANGYRYRLNYAQNISTLLNIEAGAQGRLRIGNDINEIFYYEQESDDYIFQPNFSHDVSYHRNINALYGLGKGEWNDIGYQIGLRAEHTYRSIRMEDISENFEINRLDFFPTAHFSYQIGNGNQLMTGYTRRINRPRGWYLEPFLTWTDAYNVRTGNPDILPEYINSYEIAYQKEFGKNAFSAELYYRTTENKIERYRSIYSESVTMHTFANVGKDYSLGTEIMLNLSLTNWWETNLTGNFYDYRVKGQLGDRVFDSQSFTWSARWNNIIKLGKSTRLQINPSYRGPTERAQEVREGYFVANVALRQNFFENKINLTLQARDVFSTRKHESYIDEIDFYNYRYRSHKTPIVMLNVSWRINNFNNREARQDAAPPGDNGMNGGEM